MTSQKKWYEDNVKVILTQDWFIAEDNGAGKRLEVHNVIYRLVEGQPEFQCDDREVLQNNYEDFWNEYVVPFEQGEVIITASGYFYFPAKNEIHVLVPGYKSVVKTKNNPDDASWVESELKGNRHEIEF